MKIVQVPRRFVASDWGGTETVVLETGKRLLAEGHQTLVMCPSALSETDRETIGGVEVRRYPYFYPYFGLSAAAKDRMDRKGGNMFSFALMRALKAEPDLDLIHLHTAKRVGGIARRVARRRRIPYVVSVHGGVFGVPANEATTWTESAKGAIEWGKALGLWVGSRRVLDDAAALIFVNAREAEAARGRYPNKRVEFLPNGVDVARFARGDGERFRKKRRIPAKARLILAVGRIDPQKNQELAVKALAGLSRDFPAARLCMVGHVTNKAYRDRVLQLARTLGVADRVTLVEGLPADSQELVDAYHAADAFLLPSVHEPFGIVILEAWAAAKPVVAAKVGGVPSFAEHKRDALLFDSGDERGCLGALGRVFGNPDLAGGLAQAGKMKAAEQYSWEKVTERLLEIYRSAIDENPLRQ